MATKFNGFTQDEINRVAGKSDKPKKVLMMNRGGIQRMPDKKQTPPAEIMGTKGSKELPKMGTRMMSSSTPKDAINKNPLPEKDIPRGDNDLELTLASISMQEVLHFRPPPTVNNGRSGAVLEPQPVDESILHVSSTSEVQPVVQVPESASPFRGISLKDFQTQQKLLQEQNKQRKDLLHKAIEHHSQKTAAEIAKIQTIKSELDKLDSDLAADVAILRKKIEDATIQYSNIRKSYERVEAQFLKAKQDLYQASEKKELLTEHLCAVIAHNENRKGKKLTELMEQVGMSPIGEMDLTAKSNGNSTE